MSYIGNQPTSVAFLTDQFSGTGSQTAFTLSAAPANTASILVAVSGVLQDPTTYSVSGLTLTFSAAPPSATANISVRYLGIPASGVTTTAYRTVTEFTATAGQTTFTIPSYTAGYISVYRNGVMLGSADYTASNGTTVVLATGATAGDLITTESFYVSSVLNAIPAVANAVTSTYLNTGAVTQTKLGTNVAGNGPAFMATRTGSAQSISSGTWTKVDLNAEGFDTNNNFASGTFTPTVAGYYRLDGTMFIGGSATRTLFGFWKNGAEYLVWWDDQASDTGQPCRASASTLLYMNGTTDYVELYGYLTGSSLTFGVSSSVSQLNGCVLSGSLVRAA
jgi:hypothetical protein